MTCVYLRWLMFTLIELKFARKWTQVFHRLVTQHKSTQVGFSIVFFCMVARAKLHWNGFLATCVELASTCESVWLPNASRRKLASGLFSLYGHACKAALKWLSCYLRWTYVYLRVCFATHRKLTMLLRLAWASKGKSPGNEVDDLSVAITFRSA